MSRQNKFSVKVTTPPATEPVTVAEVKTHTRISGSDQDALIAKWIKSGRELAESFQRRAYISQTIEVSYDCFPIIPFSLPRSPVIELKEIKYYSLDNTETIVYDADSPVGTEDNYLIDTDSEPARITLAYGCSFPSSVLREINSFKVVYTAGYGSDADNVPENVKDAIMLYVGWRYENRAAETNAVPEQFYNLLDSERLFL